MASTESSRDHAIDFIKSIGILLVVLGHINSPFGKIIYSFHMPLFFIISGALLFGENSLKQFHRDIKNLIVPALLFFIIGYLVTGIKNLYLDRETESFYLAFKNLINWTDSKHINNYGFVIWFLLVLFWGKFIANSIIFKNSKYETVIILTAISILVLLKKYFSIIITLGIDIAIFIVPFMLLGYLTYKYKYTVLKYKYYVLLNSMAILFFMIEIYGIQWVDIGSREYENYVVSFFYSYLIFLFLYIYFNIFILNKNYYLIFFLGENTIFILLFHPYTNNISDKIISMVSNEYRWILIFILSVFMCSILVIIYKYILKFLRGISLGA
jgi:acyltransferase